MHFIDAYNLILFKQLEYKDHTCFFHALTFAGSCESCLNTRPLGRVLKHCPRNPASVNAIKQTGVIVILAFLNHASFLIADFSKQNAVSVKLSNVSTSPQRHRRVQSFCKQKHWRKDYSRPQHFPV